MPRLAGLAGLWNAGRWNHDGASLLVRDANTIVSSQSSRIDNDTACRKNDYQYRAYAHL
jgi:hypothetical protein